MMKLFDFLMQDINKMDDHEKRKANIRMIHFISIGLIVCAILNYIARSYFYESEMISTVGFSVFMVSLALLINLPLFFGFSTKFIENVVIGAAGIIIILAIYAFSQYSSITIWCISLIIIEISLIAMSPKLLFFSTGVSIIMLIGVWIFYPENWVKVDASDHFVRIGFVVFSASIAVAINRMYLNRIAESMDKVALLKVKNEELEQLNRRVKESEERFRTIFEQSPLGIALADSDTHKIYQSNDKFTEIMGRSIEEVDRIGWRTITHPDDIQEDEEKWESFEKGEITGYNINKRYILPDGSHTWANLTISKVIVSGNAPQMHMIMIEDITERKKATDEIIFYSYHDQLTGVYNRRFYEEEIKKIDTEGDLPISIIIGDVNGLKIFNDAFGHNQGDVLLKKAAEIIQTACRENDIVFRWGGDEFVVILPSTTSEETQSVVDVIKKLCAKEFINDISLSISFGWDTKDNLDELIIDKLKNAEDQMYKHKILESEGLRGNLINTILHSLHEKNPREEMHSIRASSLCQSIGKALELSELQINKLKVVGLLHDIGKIAIEESILDKPEKLTYKEWEEIRKHPDIGYRILSSSADMKELAEITLSHHERWDGTGYPKGLEGEAIPMLSRIVALADSYDVMTSDRPYRKALTKEAALKEILDNSGTQFDPGIAKVFVNIVIPGFEKEPKI